ncbi:ADP-ribosylation factor-related protein 1 isoform X2 [Hemitrygon akajei]|uniref:ADP-ribosylation factor-related protein 1 isoform X2 n=1 Tax=Hemitrygon akajei TaxID=2704970 RepID=UPI003BF98DA5
MYTLLSGLWKYMFQKDEYCILILGLDNAGKTTFLEQTKTKFSRNYKGMNFSKITTTVGLNIGTIDIGSARLMFWDLGGQEELQSLWDKEWDLLSGPHDWLLFGSPKMQPRRLVRLQGSGISWLWRWVDSRSVPLQEISVSWETEDREQAGCWLCAQRPEFIGLRAQKK